MGYYNTGAQKDTAIAKRCKLEKRGGGDEPLDSGWLLPDTRLTYDIASNHHRLGPTKASNRVQLRDLRVARKTRKSHVQVLAEKQNEFPS